MDVPSLIEKAGSRRQQYKLPALNMSVGLNMWLGHSRRSIFGPKSTDLAILASCRVVPECRAKMVDPERFRQMSDAWTNFGEDLASFDPCLLTLGLATSTHFWRIRLGGVCRQVWPVSADTRTGLAPGSNSEFPGAKADVVRPSFVSAPFPGARMQCRARRRLLTWLRLCCRAIPAGQSHQVDPSNMLQSRHMHALRSFFFAHLSLELYFV